MEETLMHHAPLAVMDYVGPAIGALLCVAAMSLVAEPTRRTLNAIILAGASGVYLSGGFGLWELVYPVIGTAIGFRALRSYPTSVRRPGQNTAPVPRMSGCTPPSAAPDDARSDAR